jgi:hypothetical protein
MATPPTLNCLDIIKGALCDVTVAPWVTNMGSSTGVSLGALKGIELYGERKRFSALLNSRLLRSPGILPSTPPS